MSTPLCRWWHWGVGAYESPRYIAPPTPEEATSEEIQAWHDGYRARSAANPPVPQRAEYYPDPWNGSA